MPVDLSARIGTYDKTSAHGDIVRAYVPRPLPPDPPIDLPRLTGLLARADQALGRLDGMAAVLPSPDLFVFMYVRKEALLSSQIEGTQSSLSDLLLFEEQDTPLAPLDDVQDVSNYIAAMTHGLARLGDDFPLSLRLIREMHAILLSKGRGSSKQPGEFRTSQNWIGGSRPGNALFVPPPPNRVLECLGSLETFWHDRSAYSPLIRAALSHLQFETIHPFLDGNGRLGRLLITLLLCEEKVLNQPILYLSLYFKTHRTHYYDLLQTVREKGDWETWIEFFLEGVEETSNQGVVAARRILELFARDEATIAHRSRQAPSLAALYAEIKKRPVVTVPALAKRMGISQPTLKSSIDYLAEKGVLKEITGKRRNRAYAYAEYLRILDEGTEPIRL
jgi:Fic family protein